MVGVWAGYGVWGRNDPAGMVGAGIGYGVVGRRDPVGALGGGPIGLNGPPPFDCSGSVLIGPPFSGGA